MSLTNHCCKLFNFFSVFVDISVHVEDPCSRLGMRQASHRRRAGDDDDDGSGNDDGDSDNDMLSINLSPELN